MSFINIKLFPLSSEFKELLTNFVLEAIEHDPVNVYEFASVYFRNLLNRRGAFLSPQNVPRFDSIFRSNATSIDIIEDIDINNEKTERRLGISSESLTPGNVHSYNLLIGHASEKNLYQKETLRLLISRIMIFKNLPEDDIEEIISKMMKLEVSTNDIIVSEGDEEEFLFLIQSGTFEVYKTNDDGELILIKTFQNQGSFGELALIYKTNQTGTVKATSNGVIWCLDRLTFKRIVVEKANQRRLQCDDFLSKISLLESLSSEEKAKIADAIELKTFEKNVIIFKQGHIGDYIYFIGSGKVSIILERDKMIKEIAILNVGDYFGELSLMTNWPRAATAKTLERTTVGMMNRESFERLLGPCLDVLKRNANNYDSNMKQYFKH